MVSTLVRERAEVKMAGMASVTLQRAAIFCTITVAVGAEGRRGLGFELPCSSVSSVTSLSGGGMGDAEFEGGKGKEDSPIVGDGVNCSMSMSMLMFVGYGFSLLCLLLPACWFADLSLF